MPKARFGRRSTPPRYLQAQRDAALPTLEGEVIFRCSEADGTTFSYPQDVTCTPGALRLVSVRKLLAAVGTGVVELWEWTGWDAWWPRDDEARLVADLPPQWPRYAAISHVWAASDDAARLARDADRPLHIQVGGPELHAISWLGLVQAAVTAHAHRCDYLWLDLLCLDQLSATDKGLQIRNMAAIYRHASMVVIMPGGVAAAQNFDQPSAWINRAWTFQEATLARQSYVLVSWSLRGSFSYFSKLRCPGRVGPMPAIAVASLQSLAEHGPLTELGTATLVADDGTGSRQYESRSRVLCLGSNAASVSALASAIGASEPEKENAKDGFRPSAFHDSDGPALPPGWDTDESSSDDDGDYARLVQKFHKAADSSPGRETTGAPNPSHIARGAMEEEQAAARPAFLDLEAGVRYASVWRSMWLRTSTRPQDLVYSMMHLLGAQIKVDYRRSVDELIFELVGKTRSAPAWLAIGYHLPVRPESGLIPLYPDFGSHLEPTFSFGGTAVPVSEVVCNGDFFCSEFDIDIKHSSLTDGHLVCALVLDIDKISGHNPEELDPDSLSLHEVQLSLSCPPAYRLNATCRFKGHVGSLAVVVGDHSQEAGLGFSASHFSKPFVIFLERKKTGMWQKTGAGWLDETLAAVGIGVFRMTRRHLRVGAGSADKVPVECDCVNAERHRPPPDQRKEGMQDLDAALGEAAAHGDERRVSWLIGQGANANAQLGDFGGTPLLAACCHRNVRIVKLLLTSGADANAAASVYSTELESTGSWFGMPLQLACLLGLRAIARALIEGGAHVNASVGREGSPLQAAVRRRYDALLTQLLLDHGADANGGGGIYGTPLMAMFHQDHPLLEVAELLVRHGADINNTAGRFITEDGWLCCSALQMACRYGDVKMVRGLLALGADANLRSRGSFATPLQEAAACGQSLICEALLGSGAQVNAEGGHFHSALQAAVAESPGCSMSEHTVRLLIGWGVDVNAKGGYYGSALLAANAVGSHSIYGLLTDNGAIWEDRPGGCPGPTVGESQKWMPGSLHFASGMGRLEVVEELLERVPPIGTDDDGRTALHAACANGHVAVAEVLLRRGANVFAVDQWGNTPLHLAASGSYSALVRLLLDAGADPTAADGEGNSAISRCAGHLEIVTLLLDRIAASDPDCGRRALGELLLELIENGCYMATQLLLLSDSCQLDAATVLDAQGRNAAHLAAQTGRLDMLNLVLGKGIDPRATVRQLNDGLLHYAARGSSVDVVRSVLLFFSPGAGESDTPVGSGGWTPLHWACRSGDVCMVRLLLGSGLRPSTVVTTTPPAEWTPHAIAGFHQNTTLLTALAADPELAASLGRPKPMMMMMTTTTATRMPTAVEEAAALGPDQKLHEFSCDGCWLDIYGIRFHCIECANFDYCFMCKLGAHITHPGHPFEADTWEWLPAQRRTTPAPTDWEQEFDSDSDDSRPRFGNRCTDY
ncbi:ankyrin repeat-containing domain protein [Lasiosphaeria hispida]|uniref:Ankyrin repeat-containing domain protein n=1 Tax=Lasiosphaeria hispida TaxID=260671 RepID=A0AAJ0M7X0_9PEZI|nr:ankyrin repeat-containing domain protein [Lasiosphaeria hispida]